MTFAEAINYLESFTSFGIKPGLHRIHALLEILGNPEQAYKTIHVTGTNGKGSVTAFIFEILKASSYRCGRFTSPHLYVYNERMRVDDADITDEEFADLVADVKKAVDKMIAQGEESPTQFEVLTAAAFLYFKNKGVDYAVIEVGLGGLLDSTNVINPEVAVITNVSLDHLAYCGDNINSIAKHKAGIIKDNIPVVTGVTGKSLEVIKTVAQEKNAEVYTFENNAKLIKCTQILYGQDIDVEYKLKETKTELNLQTKMLGEHQVNNLILAVMAVKVLFGENIKNEIIKTGVAKTYWPGRFEQIVTNGQIYILDGAHNEAGAISFAKTYRQRYDDKPKVLIMGILKDKPVENIIKNIVKDNDIVLTVAVPTPRTMQPEILAKMMPTTAHACQDMVEAIEKATALSQGEKAIVICGSLYILGEARCVIEQ